MFRNQPTKQDEPHIRFGPHEVELIPCHDTPQLSELTRLYLAVKIAVEKLQTCKTKAGLWRGKLSPENQQRSTASESFAVGMEAVNRLYAFAAARAEFDLEILHVRAACTALGEFLGKSLVQEPNPLSSEDCYVPSSSDARWMLSDVAKDAPSPLTLIVRHNVASAICLLRSLHENLPSIRAYFRQLPEFPNVLWNAYCAQEQIIRGMPTLWQALVQAD